MENKVLLISIIVGVIIIGTGIFFYFGSSDIIGGEDKPSPVAEQCVFACDTEQKAAFCDVSRKADDSVTATCQQLATNSQYSKYNVQVCPSIDCSAPPEGNSVTAQDQGCSRRS